jgi:hypothetical protein
MRVLREGDGQEITLEGLVLGRGGEASVYAVPGRPELAAKIYHHPTPEHAGKLAAMLAAPPVPPPAGTGHVAIAWPLERLLEAGGERRVVGALVPRVEAAHMLWELYNPGARQELCPQFHHGALLRTARNLACVVRTLHERGYVVGDLNESNVLATPQALVTLIDADSFQVPAAEGLYRCRVGRPEYTPPELQGVAFAEVDRQQEHDAFALAVLIFQLLMQGVHPFAGICTDGALPAAIPARIAAGAWPYAWPLSGPVRPGPHAPPWCVLPPDVQDLLSRCFEDGHGEPVARPGAAEWQLALEEAERQLTPCTHNSQHVYARGLDVCPWCALARQQGRDPFPALGQAPPRRPSRTRLTRTGGTALHADRLSSGLLREDPLPPRPAPVSAGALARPAGVEAGFQAVGALVERQGWLPWLGTALVGIVAGLLWALNQPASPDAAPAAESRSRPEPPRTGRPVPPAGKAYLEAFLQSQQAANDYRRALRAYEEAVNASRQGGVGQEELLRRSREVQAGLRRWREAQQALAELGDKAAR